MRNTIPLAILSVAVLAAACDEQQPATTDVDVEARASRFVIDTKHTQIDRHEHVLDGSEGWSRLRSGHENRISVPGFPGHVVLLDFDDNGGRGEGRNGSISEL